MCNGPSRSSKVVDFGTIESAYATSYWSSTVIISEIFQRHYRFSAEKSDPTLFHPNFSRNVNKDLTLKAKARTKDWTFKAKARTKEKFEAIL